MAGLEETGGFDDYAGAYSVIEEPGVHIVATDRGLVARLPGAPPRFDAALERDQSGDPDRFRIAAGPLAGLPMTFARDEGGRVSTLNVGGLDTLNRQPLSAETHDYLYVPDLELDDEKAAAFEKLWAEEVEGGDGRLLTYALDHRKHEFLRFLAERKPVVLHGSNLPDIERFEPRRHTLGGSASGSLRGVYACTDGIWPLYFAVVDRKNYPGSLRNGAMPIENEYGEKARLYYFSLDREELAREPGPWTDGTIYILPGETFSQTVQSGLLPLEVVSEVPVRPLAKLAVTPEDFPFLHDVYGHDDTRSYRNIELARRLYSECTDARPLDDGYALRYEWSLDLVEAMMEYIDMERFGNSWRSFEILVEPDGGAVWLTMRGSEALRDVIERGLADARNTGSEWARPASDR